MVVLVLVWPARPLGAADSGYAHGIVVDWGPRAHAQALADRSAGCSQRPRKSGQVTAPTRRGSEVREDLTSGEASALLDIG